MNISSFPPQIISAPMRTIAEAQTIREANAALVTSQNQLRFDQSTAGSQAKFEGQILALKMPADTPASKA